MGEVGKIQVGREGGKKTGGQQGRKFCRARYRRSGWQCRPADMRPAKAGDGGENQTKIKLLVKT